jgi:hypothetical protein
VAFVAVRPDILNPDMDWADERSTIIAVVNFTKPTIVEVVLEFGAKAVLPSPNVWLAFPTLVLARH